jgi:hypothetical protein
MACGHPPCRYEDVARGIRCRCIDCPTCGRADKPTLFPPPGPPDEKLALAHRVAEIMGCVCVYTTKDPSRHVYECRVPLMIELIGRVALAETQLLKRRIETLQSEERVLTCVYCGHEYPPGTASSGVPALTEHVKNCPEHPMFKLRVAAKRYVEAMDRATNADTGCRDATMIAVGARGDLLKLLD